MIRRSSRLATGGYYQSDEDSDSSSASVSYRESPVKVFNKRRRTGKAASSLTSSRANSTASPSCTRDEPISNVDYIGMVPWKQGQTSGGSPSMTPGPAPVAAPRVVLADPRAPSLRRPSEGLSSRPGGAQSQGSADSSGYSSSGAPGRTRPASSPTAGGGGTQVDTMDRICSYAGALFTIGVRKALLLLLLLLLLLGMLASLSTILTLMNQPGPSARLPTPPFTDTDVTAVIKAAPEDKVSTILEDKVNTILREMDILKHKEQQQILVSEMVQRLQADVTHVEGKVKSVDSEHRARLHQDMADLRAELRVERAGTLSTMTLLHQALTSLRAQHAGVRSATSALRQENAHLRRVTALLRQRVEAQESRAVATFGQGCSRPMAEGMPDFALESQGASVVSTRCSETYHIRSAVVSLLGFPLWYHTESPRTVIQGHPVLLPGRCWAFQGAQGSLVIALSHPVMISHVTLDHLPRVTSPTGHIHSAPKDFHVYGMSTEGEEGTLLGTFTYDQQGESTQTFGLPDPNEVVYRYVELSILSNWGHLEYTCLYRFRVHGGMASM